MQEISLDLRERSDHMDRVLWTPGLRNEEKAYVKAQHEEICKYPDKEKLL